MQIYAAHAEGNKYIDEQSIPNLYENDTNFKQLIDTEAQNAAKEAMNNGGNVDYNSLNTRAIDQLPKGEFPKHPVTRQGFLKISETALLTFNKKVTERAVEIVQSLKV